jgi:intracellular sulfur oxidation DsrE/DsrF family protein
MKAPTLHFWIFFFLLLLANSWERLAYSEEDDLFPEQESISAIVAGERPEGILFLVMEQDDEALKWVLPRILRYTAQLRAVWRELPIAVLSHGDEMFGLISELEGLYPDIHGNVLQLLHEYGVAFHVCGTYAAMSDVSASEFPDYVDVVPFGPAQIENYRELGFDIVSVELTW